MGPTTSWAGRESKPWWVANREEGEKLRAVAKVMSGAVMVVHCYRVKATANNYG